MAPREAWTANSVVQFMLTCTTRAGSEAGAVTNNAEACMVASFSISFDALSCLHMVPPICTLLAACNRPPFLVSAAI